MPVIAAIRVRKEKVELGWSASPLSVSPLESCTMPKFRREGQLSVVVQDVNVHTRLSVLVPGTQVRKDT